MWNDGSALYHYGVKGQKWGERQYQNEDGSLTEEGRRHYGVGDSRDAGPATPKLSSYQKKKLAKQEREKKTRRIEESARTAKSKAAELSKIGNHEKSAEYYRKDYSRRMGAVVIGNLAYSSAARLAASYLEGQVRSGKMSMEKATNIGSAADIGRKVASAYLLGSAFDSARKFRKEYWTLG